mgnify:CR=1 FL=1
MVKHDRSFFNAMFLQHAEAVGAFIRSRCPHEDAVADIVQEAFVRLIQYPNPEEIREPRAFLIQTAANVAVDYYRRNNTRDRFAANDADVEKVQDWQFAPDRHCENHEALQLFEGWLGELPELQRHAFVLRRIEGYSHAEIASKLGLSLRCTERYVQLAMRHLAIRLRENK